MNKIYDLHYEISPLEAQITDTVEQANEKIMRDIKACEKHAAVTADVAVKFLEYVRDNGYYYHDPEYGPKGWTTSLFKNGVTTTELFNSEEFQKTI